MTDYLVTYKLQEDDGVWRRVFVRVDGHRRERTRMEADRYMASRYSGKFWLFERGPFPARAQERAEN